MSGGLFPSERERGTMAHFRFLTNLIGVYDPPRDECQLVFKSAIKEEDNGKRQGEKGD
jgi:hypothetical protein